VKPVYLLDTTVVSEPTRPQPESKVLDRLQRADGLCVIAAVVWHELRFGTERLPDGARKQLLVRYLNEVVQPYLPVIPYDGHAAFIHANLRLDALAAAEGARQLPFIDSMIAATALANNLILVTRNLADFHGIPHLMLENWWE